MRVAFTYVESEVHMTYADIKSIDLNTSPPAIMLIWLTPLYRLLLRKFSLQKYNTYMYFEIEI